MTTDATNFLTTFFSKIYQLFQITVPGLNVSFFSLFIGVLITTFVINFAFKFLGLVTNLGGSSVSQSLSRPDRKSKSSKGE